MNRLVILYDGQCHFCRRCRAWLGQQPAFVPLTFIPLQSPEVACRFPGIGRLHPEKEMVVVSDAGDVWQGGSARDARGAAPIRDTRAAPTGT